MYSFNWFAILVAALIHMILGGIWYSPKVFGTEWMKLIGMSEEKAQKGAGKAMGASAVLAIIGALGLSAAVQWVSKGSGGAQLSFLNGAMLGLQISIAFTLTVLGSNYVFNQHPRKLFVIDLTYPPVSYLIQGGLLAVWV